jgi:hypothetical protein
MGKIKRFPQKVVVYLPMEEVLYSRVHADKDVFVTLALFIGKYAEMKAMEKDVELPTSCRSIRFDSQTSEFIVTFANGPERTI